MEKLGQNKGIDPELELIQKSINTTFSYRTYSNPYFERNWHYHLEYELLLITGGYGQRFVGDSVEDFKEGDLVLIGPYLPHAWISDSKFVKPGNTEMCESIFVQFNGKVFDSMFFELPEFKGVKDVVKRADRGLKILGEAKNKIKEIILSFPDLDPFERAVQVIRIFNFIHKGDFKYLSSTEFVSGMINFKSQRMSAVHQYVMRNFKNEITVDDCAKLIGLTKSSFCRYFKKQTKKTFTDYLKSIRVDFAKRLIVNTDLPIKEIGYDCGFESTSYFNQVFKYYTGKSPKQLRGK